MTLTANAVAGASTVRRPYTKPEDTLRHMAVKIREAGRDPGQLATFRQFAEGIVSAAGYSRDKRLSHERCAQIFLDYIRKNVRYRHDPPMVEYVQGASITLCVPGAAACIPVADCFPKGTLLLRDDFEFVRVEDIKPGDRIWGRDRWTRVEAKAFKGRLQVDAVEMNNGSTMYLTPDHKVYAGRCKHGKSAALCQTCAPIASVETFDRVRVGDLLEGDTLLRPERIDFGTGEQDPERLYVEGLALADGWVRDDCSCFYVAGRDGMRKEAQKHEVKAICDRLGIATHWHRRYIVVKDREWATRIAQLGARARFKHAETLNLNERSAEALLRGLMADSTANKHGLGRTYSTTSPTMAVQVRVLHRMFGKSTGWKMLTPEQHRGAGKHPLWRLGQRGNGQQKEWALAVRSIERSVRKVECWDIQTEDHYVYLPEHDVTVSNCDDLIVAFGGLCLAYGVEMQVIAQDFGPDKDLHVCAAIKSDAGEWLAADPTHPTLPVGRRLPAIKELWMDPLEPGELNLDGAPNAEFVAVGAIPRDALVHARQFGDVPASTWTLVSPAADGTLPVVAGTRYKMIVATPTNEPASGDATTLGAIAYLLFPALSVPASALIAYGLGASGSAWTAGDTTALFSGSGKWLVESVTGSAGAWQVQAIAKESMSLQGTKDVTYIQVLQQTPAAVGAGPAAIVPAAGFTTAQKVVFGGIVLSVVAGGIYVAVKHHQRYEIPRKAALSRHALARGER